MTQTTLQHIKANLPTLEIWFKMKERIDPSNDMLKPIVVDFKEEFPEVNINGCPNCVNDMIGWAIIEYKKTLKPKKNDKGNDEK